MFWPQLLYDSCDISKKMSRLGRYHPWRPLFSASFLIFHVLWIFHCFWFCWFLMLHVFFWLFCLFFFSYFCFLFSLFTFFSCVSFLFKFSTFGQEKRASRSVATPTNQSFRVCQVNLATFRVAIIWMWLHVQKRHMSACTSLHIVLLDGHIERCVHCSQNCKGNFTSAYGDDVQKREHTHTHTYILGTRWVLEHMSVWMEM